MILIALTTAIIVSLDGFFSGIALGVKKTKITLNKLFLIGLMPIIMAIPIMLFGSYIKDYIQSNLVNYISFILFAFLAINAFVQIRKNKENELLSNITLFGSIIVGLSIGLDSSISAFSLAIEGHNPFITPIYFGVAHFILIWFGNFLALKYSFNNIKPLKYLSPILFIIIAFSKL